jgi:hypothetical protein
MKISRELRFEWENHRKTMGKPKENGGLPSGNLTVRDGKSPCLVGKSIISMAIFNSYV